VVPTWLRSLFVGCYVESEANQTQGHREQWNTSKRHFAYCSLQPVISTRAADKRRKFDHPRGSDVVLSTSWKKFDIR
jgi:hypothetical protein